MTRFALCAAVHTEAAKRLVGDDELAAAVGFAFARLYAILKNARRNAHQQQPRPSQRQVYGRPTNQSPDELPTYQLGRILFKVDPNTKKAFVKLGDGWVDGSSWKGLAEIAKVPPDVLEFIRINFSDDLLTSERRVFEFYRSLRDRFGL